MIVYFSHCTFGVWMWMCFDQCASADWKRALSRKENYQSMHCQCLLHSKQRCVSDAIVKLLPSSSAWWMGKLESVLLTMQRCITIYRHAIDVLLLPPHNNTETLCHPVLHGKIKGWLYIQAAEPQLTAHHPQCNIYSIQSGSLPKHGKFVHQMQGN